MSYSHNKTVFIVGAGASCEFDLPSGLQLRDKVAEALDLRFSGADMQIGDGDSTIYKALQREAERNAAPRHNIGDFIAACWQIRDGMQTAQSIDHYIDSHTGNRSIELCGKLAIVRLILDAEQKSSLYLDPDATAGADKKLNFIMLREKWLSSFMHKITEHSTARNLQDRLNSIALVIFNYDRCIEHYLYHALRNHYPSLSLEEIATHLKRMEIYHPYGSAGPLTWMTRQGLSLVESPTQANSFSLHPGSRHLRKASMRLQGRLF
jgi:hypothetical protein